ncbi:MAG: phage tail sheath C-terminal domain-containing protein [Myxococcota bacterium]
MALPGLSFEVVRPRTPTTIRSDRGAIALLAARGPVGEVVSIEGRAQLEQVFGCPEPGMLGVRAGHAFFANGGEELLVVRIEPSEARSAGAGWPLVDGGVLSLRAREPGAFGSGLRLRARLRVARRARGTAPSATTFQTATTDAENVGRPALVSSGLSKEWTVIQGVGATGYTVSPALTFGPATPLVMTLFERHYEIDVVEPGRSERTVNLDPNDVGAFESALEGTPIAVDGAVSPGVLAFPQPDSILALTGGDDGLDPAGDSGALADAFRAAFEVLEASSSADLVFCPDLWSRVFRQKGIRRLALDAFQARELAVDLVRRAARASDRVVLLDPPLTEDATPRPYSREELLDWRRELESRLRADRDFAALHGPWVRVAAPEHPFRGDETLIEPPSGYVAGRMARTGLARGPWIATGGTDLAGVVGLSENFAGEDLEALADVGINPLTVGATGVSIRGVRSLSYPDRRPWRFLSTRRLFNYLRRVLEPIGRTYAFEPNTPSTWLNLRRDIESVLRALFAQGAFSGSTNRDAFFVKVDATLNPEAARENGVLTAHIGVAPAAPLEFLLVRLVANQDGAAVVEEA